MNGLLFLRGEKQHLVPGDEGFPERVLEIPEPPGELHVLGNVEALHTPGIAVVGARKATPYGLGCARHFAKLAAGFGITVVSGGAIGCDQSAHRGALDAEGTTVVVLGCGADVVYPKVALKLYERVLETGGAIVSEAPWGAPPTKWGFSRRNRIIAALARATLIVEAGLPSGTFQTADATLNQGKDVMAIPGSINSAESKGSNRLIADGATPIIDDRTFEDALMQVFGSDVLLMRSCAQYTDNREDNGLIGWQKKTITALTASPMRAEDMLGLCGNGLVEVIRNISQLEMAGFVERLRDGRYTCARPMR